MSIVTYIFFLRTLGSYLYSRLTLKMTIDFTQAKKLNDALSPNPFPFTSLKWLSLKEVKGLDKENKYNAAIELLDKWTEEKRVNREAQI